MKEVRSSSFASSKLTNKLFQEVNCSNFDEFYHRLTFKEYSEKKCSEINEFSDFSKCKKEKEVQGLWKKFLEKQLCVDGKFKDDHQFTVEPQITTMTDRDIPDFVFHSGDLVSDSYKNVSFVLEMKQNIAPGNYGQLVSYISAISRHQDHRVRPFGVLMDKEKIFFVMYDLGTRKKYKFTASINGRSMTNLFTLVFTDLEKTIMLGDYSCNKILDAEQQQLCIVHIGKRKLSMFPLMLRD